MENQINPSALRSCGILLPLWCVLPGSDCGLNMYKPASICKPAFRKTKLTEGETPMIIEIIQGCSAACFHLLITLCRPGGHTIGRIRARVLALIFAGYVYRRVVSAGSSAT